MPSSHSLDRLDSAFDDGHLVADAGLLLPATLAQHLGLKELVETHLKLGARAGRANVGDKLLSLVMSALAGGDCIDDADALRAGGTGRVLGFNVKAPSTLGTFMRSFRWGHVRQLDRVSRELLARAWAAGAGPGTGPLTIDLDSTICETYGLQKEGATRFTYDHVRGYHPLLAVAAGTGDVLMARLRGGNANSGRSAGHFLRETSAGCAGLAPADSSRCEPTRASMPTPWSRCVGRRTSASASPSASTPLWRVRSRPSPRRPGPRSPSPNFQRPWRLTRPISRSTATLGWLIGLR